MKKKVLHLITGVEHGGGAENMILKTLPYLEKTNNAVCAMTGHGQKGRELEEAGVKVFYLDMRNKLDVRGIFRYRKVLKEYQPDLQVNYLIHADIFGRVFGKLLKVPKIVSYIRNRNENGFWSSLDHETIRFTDLVLTNSEANLQVYHLKYGVPKEKLACIPNGVEIPEFEENTASEIRKELNISEEIPVITCVARLTPQKSHMTLLHALWRLKGEGRRFKVLLVGEGEDRAKLEAKVEVLDLIKEVDFLEKRQDVGAVLSASDVFVLPSLHEGMSNALLEAMSRALPCVVSNIPENEELITNGENGLTSIVRDSEDLAEKLASLLENKERQKELGEKAKETVKEKYDIVKIRKDLDNFFYEQAK